MNMKVPTTLLLFLMVAMQANADSFTNEKLLSNCKEFEQAVAMGSTYIQTAEDERLKIFILAQRCSGFLEATRQSIQSHSIRKEVCIPPDATLIQLSAIYTKYIGERPSYWHKSAFLSVVASWEKAFPCQ